MVATLLENGQIILAPSHLHHPLQLPRDHTAKTSHLALSCPSSSATNPMSIFVLLCKVWSNLPCSNR